MYLYIYKYIIYLIYLNIILNIIRRHEIISVTFTRNEQEIRMKNFEE